MKPILNKIFPITQKFWQNPEIYKRFNLAWHNGFDFAVPEWTPIFSPIDGEVFFIDYQPTWYWKYIKLRDDKNEIVFAYLSFIWKEIWEKVKVWDFLWYTWNTGFSTWPYLHFGIRELKKWYVENYDNWYFWYVDPQKYFSDDENFFWDEKKLVDPWKNLEEKNFAKNYDNVADWAKDWYDFVVEEWISNWERPKEFISREEFLLMIFRFSEFIWEERELDEDFKIDFEKLDIADRPSEWAGDAYLFVVSEKISNWERPKEFISREEAWVILFRFLRDYHQFQKVPQIDKYKDEKVRSDWLSDWAKRAYDWVLKNWISNWERPKEFISREEIWVMLLRCYEVLED